MIIYVKKIGCKSVVVQNFHGELRPFHNVCSHRFSRIRTNSKGNSGLNVSTMLGFMIVRESRLQFPISKNLLRDWSKVENL